MGLVKELKDSGIISQPVAAVENMNSPQWQIELEKIRTERDLKLAELNIRKGRGRGEGRAR